MFSTIPCLACVVLSVVFVSTHAATGHGDGWRRFLPWRRRNPPSRPNNDVRRQLWLRLARIDEKVIEDAANEMQQLLLRKGELLERDRKQIAEDLKRVDTNHDTLENILQAYALYDDDVKYLQSMNFIAAPIVRLFDSHDNFKATAFAFFKHIMITHRDVIINFDRKDEQLYGENQVLNALKSFDRRGTSNVRGRLTQIGMYDLKLKWTAMFIERIMGDNKIEMDIRYEQGMVVIDNYLAFGFSYLVSMAAALIYEARELIDHEEYSHACKIVPGAPPQPEDATCVGTIISALKVEKANHNVDGWLALAHQIRKKSRP